MDPKASAQEKALAVDSGHASRDVSVIETGGWDIKATKRLLWKLDLHIVPIMSLIYLYVSSVN